MSTDALSADVPEIGHEHPDVTGGWLRPAVFGSIDGLVSNVALIAGVAGGVRGVGNAGDSRAVLLAGVAGLIGGAFSMATGEYISVASQSEAAAREIDKERREILHNPAGEAAELAQMYVDKGLDPVLAAEVARQIHADVDNAVSVHAREELGVDPEELPPPWVAAYSSFASFAIGAVVPLLPYFAGATVLWAAIAISLIALFAGGSGVATLTDRPWWRGGLRQLLFGGLAIVATYLVGLGIGASAAG